MSGMEFYYGAFCRSPIEVEPKDTDEYYDWEKIQGKEFVKVNGKTYEFWEIKKLYTDGFELVIPNVNDAPYIRFIAYWYNGGAGHREVIASIIERSLNEI